LMHEAAELQEVFDTELFGIPWNDGLAGAKMSPQSLRLLSRTLRLGSKRDLAIQAGWYDDLGDVPDPVDVLMCQEQNVRWDLRLRNRYRWVLVLGVGVWLVAGMIVGWLLGLGTVLTLLTWYVPSFSAVALALETAAMQGAIGAEKRRLAAILDGELESIRLAGGQYDYKYVKGVARKVQDGIFVARQEVGRVPFILYQFFRTKDEKDFARRSEFYSASSYGGSGEGLPGTGS
jgi:predicted pore-forming effector associated with SMODS systems